MLCSNSTSWTAIRMAEGLEYGIIGINDTVPATAQCPFGGMKESGIGREGGHEGLECYMETKYVSIGSVLATAALGVDTVGGSFTSVTGIARVAVASGVAPTVGSSTATVTSSDGLVS